MTRRKVRSAVVCRGESPLSRWGREYSGQNPPRVCGHVVAFQITDVWTW